MGFLVLSKPKKSSKQSKKSNTSSNTRWKRATWRSLSQCPRFKSHPLLNLLSKLLPRLRNGKKRKKMFRSWLRERFKKSPKCTKTSFKTFWSSKFRFRLKIWSCFTMSLWMNKNRKRKKKLTKLLLTRENFATDFWSDLTSITTQITCFTRTWAIWWTWQNISLDKHMSLNIFPTTIKFLRRSTNESMMGFKRAINCLKFEKNCKSSTRTLLRT